MIAILDIGKTNKKCFVFDEDYRIVFEKATQLAETVDEDGDTCEDLELLRDWVLDAIREVLSDKRFSINAINVSTYGASFVHLSREGQPLTPLYNYLKYFPDDLRKQFFDTYGVESTIALETASPILGNLNSGLQLYWLKHRKPLIFKEIKWSLHLPQYVSFLITHLSTFEKLTNVEASEITSIGCHTMLWDFQKNDYHTWVKMEGITEKFPALRPANSALVLRKAVLKISEQRSEARVYPGTLFRESSEQRSEVHTSSLIHIGTGLHDSSAALIPYLASFDEPFVLISTGTWCISLNPFNQEPLTTAELSQDCLCYLTFEGNPVKAARYFGGHEHEQAVKKMAVEFDVAEDFYLEQLSESLELSEIYTQFMHQLIEKQAISTRLALGNTRIKHLYVDGGFSKNEIYMSLLARDFPHLEVYAAEVAQATALGAAMAIHDSWNEKTLPQNLISLKRYEPLHPNNAVNRQPSAVNRKS